MTPTKPPQIPESEWKVMKILWASTDPLPAHQIVQELSRTEQWQPKTIKTLLNRLLKKRAISFNKDRNRYLYYPVVSEAACIKAESESFLKRYFDGALQPMLVHFVRRKKLKPSEIRELKKLLDSQK